MSDDSLISVIIPCYNYARFVSTAIESVLTQPVNKEIIIIDDGSTDNLKEVVQKYPEVKYYYQNNAGLSAARNHGIRLAQGKYLVFLDADDWFLPDGLKKNYDIIKKHSDYGMVVGGFVKIWKLLGISEKSKYRPRKDAYSALLRHNYFAMIHAVIFTTEVIKQFYFDETLKAAEDYDLYFKIARKYKIYHHNEPVVAYLIHGRNMTRSNFNILDYTIKVLERQRPFLKNKKQVQLLEEGIRVNTDYYYIKAFHDLENELETGSSPEDFETLYRLRKAKPRLFFSLADDYPERVKEIISENIGIREPHEIEFLQQPEEKKWLRRIKNQFILSNHTRRITNLLKKKK